MFPPRPREFSAMRGLNITLRSLHLVGMAGLAAHYLLQPPAPVSPLFWTLTLYSGLAMVLLAVWSDGRWILQMRGVVILFKLLLLWLLPWFDAVVASGAAWGFVVLILASSVISHAPARVRYFFVLRSGVERRL